MLIRESKFASLSYTFISLFRSGTTSNTATPIRIRYYSFRVRNKANIDENHSKGMKSIPIELRKFFQYFSSLDFFILLDIFGSDR